MNKRCRECNEIFNGSGTLCPAHIVKRVRPNQIAYSHPDYKTFKQFIKENYIQCCVKSCNNRGDTVDHRRSLAVGGKHTMDNLQAMCFYHNARKGARLGNKLRKRRSG